jgi:inorganic pyrophosphatase
MDLSKIAPGKNAPWDVNVVIEVPMRSNAPIKYEMDKESGALFVDRFLHTPMFYPCNYGFIPNTLGGDGDPLDVLVVGDTPIMPGAVVRVRPIGVLMMEDDGGQDEKLLAVPVTKLNPYYKDVAEYTDLPEILREQIEHFFTRYKDLEPGKWVKIGGWKGSADAAAIIEKGVAAAAK